MGHGYLQAVASFDDFREVRRRVMRRCVYSLNTLAMRDDRVPRDGAFDSAVANALAAIVADKESGREYENSEGRVKAPLVLLSILETDVNISSGALSSPNLKSLREGIEKAQRFRHGRAEDDWDVLREEHIKALIELDQHPALQVLELVDGMNLEDAATTVFAEEARSVLPYGYEESFLVSDPAFCDCCGRMTLIAEDSDVFGWGIGEGICIACGEERTYDDTVIDYVTWKHGGPD